MSFTCNFLLLETSWNNILNSKNTLNGLTIISLWQNIFLSNKSRCQHVGLAQKALSKAEGAAAKWEIKTLTRHRCM
jgi:hypothetical protein